MILNPYALLVIMKGIVTADVGVTAKAIMELLLNMRFSKPASYHWDLVFNMYWIFLECRDETLVPPSS